MNALNSPIQCRHCGKSIDAKDAFCRFCGKGQKQTIPFRYTHAGIIIFTLILGPIALPFIWKAPKMDTKIKAIYIAVNLVLTIIMLSSIFGIYNSINKQMQETLKMIEQTNDMR
jgi:hypothetical protein